MRAPYRTFMRQLAAIGCKIPPSPGGSWTFFLGDFYFLFFFFEAVVFEVLEAAEATDAFDDRDSEVTVDP